MRSKRILLVTDVPDHQGPYQAAFRARGYLVVLAVTAADALTSAMTLQPHCTVIDIRLPDADAWQLCRAMKRRPALSDVPVVILANDLSATAEQRAGCNSWLARPTVADDLVRAVEYVLELETGAPHTEEAARLGISECPACTSDRLTAGVRVGTVQYYCCGSCRLCWRVDAAGEATA